MTAMMMIIVAEGEEGVGVSHSAESGVYQLQADESAKTKDNSKENQPQDHLP